jgi:RND superfamily putative drug exporter
METLARWCYTHRRVVVLLWVVGIAAIFAIGQLVKPHYRAGDALPRTDSASAATLLQQDFPGQAGESDMIVWRVASGSVRDPDVSGRMTRMLHDVRALAHVRSVQSPYTAGGDAISKDGTVAFATVTFDQDFDQLPLDAVSKVVSVARGYGDARVSVDLAGYAVGQATMTIDTSVSEIVGVLAAMVVLALAFRSLLSMSLPLLSALVSLVPSIALIGMLSRVLVVPSFASSLTILLNLGVGIDYALFLVTRQRQGLLGAAGPQEALVDTMRTAGRSVLFAGTIVCVALLGLLGLQIGYLSGMAAAAAVGIAFTMAAALTLTPAMLGFFGQRVFSRRERRGLAAGRLPKDATGTGWARWAAFVQRRPAAFAGAAAAVMVVLAVPLFSVHLGSSDQGNDPTSSTTRRAYDDLAAGFGPGFNAPLLVVVQDPAHAGAAQRVAAALGSTPGVAAVGPAQTSPSGAVAVFETFPTASPQSRQTENLVHTLRGSVLPEALRDTGATAHVGGFTATSVDFTDAVSHRLPPFIVAVVLLGALLLLLAFRSVFVAGLTAVMNLLAIAVCFGVVVAVFNWGWAGGLLGLGRPGPIDAFLPVFLFAILFGLSMDYQVFLIGRMHDLWVTTGDHRRAVSEGQRQTGRVITAAAAVMVLVFLSFATGNRLETLFGLGLGVTVLLDAFVIRTMLVPALLHLVGPASWWLPRRLDRILPRFGFEAPDRERTSAAPQGGQPVPETGAGARP